MIKSSIKKFTQPLAVCKLNILLGEIQLQFQQRSSIKKLRPEACKFL